MQDLNLLSAGHLSLGNVSNSYTYDEVGNRTASTENGVNRSYTYDMNDRLLTAGGETYAYDNNGNTLSVAIGNTLTTYDYDYNNRLIGMIKTENLIEVDNVGYEYDLDGLRIAKNDDGVETHYLVDKNRPYGQVLKELDVTNSTTVDYLFGDDLIKQSRASNDSYYLYDGLGSTTALSDDFGVVTDTFTYNGYGVLLDSTGTTENSYLYAGEQRDSESGLYYLRARYLDPYGGRFLTQDTWMGRNTNPITLNKYIYGNSDPINHVDPSGLFGISLSSVGAATTIRSILSSASTTIVTIGRSAAVAGNTGVTGVSLTKHVLWVTAAFATLQTARNYVLMSERSDDVDATDRDAAETEDEYWDWSCDAIRNRINQLDVWLHNLYWMPELKSRFPKGFVIEEKEYEYFLLIEIYKIKCPNEPPHDRRYLDSLGM